MTTEQEMRVLIYLLGRTYDDAKSCAVMNGWDAKYVTYINYPDNLRGLRGIILYVTDSAHLRDNYREIIQMATERQCDIKYLESGGDKP